MLDLSVREAHNQVEAANPNSSGVACLACYDSGFEQNRIHHCGGYLAAISLMGGPYLREVTKVLVRANRITGQGPYALGVFWPTASYNSFVGNSVSRFTPSEAHYLFEEGANHNVVAGRHGDVIDRGKGNRITGLTKKPGNIGQQISDAMRRRKEQFQKMQW